jgi:hypothetical protein
MFSIKATPIIADAQGRFLSGEMQANLNRAGLRVLLDIGEPLLGDAVERSASLENPSSLPSTSKSTDRALSRSCATSSVMPRVQLNGSREVRSTLTERRTSCRPPSLPAARR